MVREIKVGSWIMDSKGRTGIVTSMTDNGFFARPELVPYKIKDANGNLTGHPRAIVITATHWVLQTDGNYKGLWYDSPLNDYSILFAYGDVDSHAAALGRKGGSAKSERKTEASRKNGLKGGRPKTQKGGRK